MAFQDVANALVSRQKYEAVRVEQAKAVEAYDEAVKVSLKRYIAGFASYYEVLEAQQQLFPAENALAQTELNRRVVVIQLYKALGGGWNIQDPTWVEPGNPPAAPRRNRRSEPRGGACREGRQQPRQGNRYRYRSKS